jgi:hypothetical protein
MLEIAITMCQESRLDVAGMQIPVVTAKAETNFKLKAAATKNHPDIVLYSEPTAESPGYQPQYPWRMGTSICERVLLRRQQRA